jgi:hypothetical protein
MNQRLPATLDELKTTNPGLRTTDPETHAPYRYSVLGERQYQLCAVYARENPGPAAHPAGTYCQTYFTPN